MKPFNAQIITPTGTAFEGETTGIQMPGVNGKFEVKHNHASLIALVTEGKARLMNKDRSEEVYAIGSGFVEVNDNQVILMTESARKEEPPAENY
ncbi:MAG: F0F1 ATP synthase subunit epsilon [Balneolales bacterium]